MSTLIVKPGRSYKAKNGTIIKIEEESQKLFVGFPKDSGPEADSLQFFENGNHILDPELHLVEEVTNQPVYKKRGQ